VQDPCEAVNVVLEGQILHVAIRNARQRLLARKGRQPKLRSRYVVLDNEDVTSLELLPYKPLRGQNRHSFKSTAGAFCIPRNDPFTRDPRPTHFQLCPFTSPSELE
jgi:hypothetical protein